MIGVAAFLAPIVLVMSAMAQTQGAVRTTVKDGASYLIRSIGDVLAG